MDPGVPSPATAVPTTVLGKYELGPLLGRGSFAKVYHGRSVKENDASVAIKIIDKSRLDKLLAPKIIDEISAMRRLAHPNIIRIHEVLATKKKIYMVMELAPGGDLYGKLTRRPDRRFPEKLARRCFYQIVTALMFCHRNGVAHRDVKPHNVLLAADGTVKISDFGLAALASSEGLLLKTACGTPAFAAPEVFRCRGPYDGTKADAWSCGVILYVMLVGSLPFDDSNLAEMYRRSYKRQIYFPSHLSRAARGLIHQLLDPNPNTRLSLEDMAKNPWFSAAKFGPRSMSLGDLVSLNETSLNFDRVISMNAFDIIGMNSQFDLSGLFEEGGGNKEKRFISKSAVEEVAEKVVKVGGLLGYDVEKGKGGKIWLGRGKLVLLIEALQMGPDLLVEIKVVQGGRYGGGVAVEEDHWREIKSGLGEIVFSWHDVGEA